MVLPACFCVNSKLIFVMLPSYRAQTTMLPWRKLCWEFRSSRRRVWNQEMTQRTLLSWLKVWKSNDIWRWLELLVRWVVFEPELPTRAQMLFWSTTEHSHPRQYFASCISVQNVEWNVKVINTSSCVFWTRLFDVVSPRLSLGVQSLPGSSFGLPH